MAQRPTPIDTSTSASGEPPKLSPSQRAAAAIGEAATFIVEGVTEFKDAAVGAFRTGNMLDSSDVKVDVATSPLHELFERGKQTFERHFSKFKRESTGATDATDDDGNDYYSDSDDGDWWDEILDLPKHDILQSHREKPWHEVPLPTKLYIILTGPVVSMLEVAAEWALAAGVLFLYMALVVFGSMVYLGALLTGSLATVEKLPLGEKIRFEYTAYKMFLHLEVEEAMQFRVRAPRIRALVAHDATREAKQKLMSVLVSTEINAIQANIAGSINYTEQCARISLGSVVVAALIYVVAASDQFFTTHLDFANMNTKTFDALAIILPYLLNEELSVMLSRMTLVISWFGIFRHENSIMHFFEHKFLATDTRVEHATRTEVVNNAEKMCKDIGVGAVDMSSVASLLTAVWTINFLYQSYYVDTKGSGGAPGPAGLADTMFWGMVLYSFTIIILSYLPFSSWVGGVPVQDEKYQAMLSSCRSFLLMDRLSVLQLHISDAVRDAQHHASETLVSHEEKRLIRQLRGEIIKHLDASSFVSYVLYSVSLAVVRLGEERIEKLDKIEPLRARVTYKYCSKLLIPLEKFEETEVAMAALVQAGVKTCDSGDDEETLRASEAGGLINLYNARDGAVISSLFEFEVLDTKVQHAFMDKGVVSLSSLIENPLVRDAQVYWNPQLNHVVLGLEIKVMEDYTAKNAHDRIVFASLYLAANTTRESKYEIGHGGIYIKSDMLSRKDISLGPVDGPVTVYQKVPGRARSRFLNRCFLAATDDHESCYHPDVVFGGAAPRKGTFVQRRPSAMGYPTMSVSRTGSASHMTGDRYNSAKLSATAKIFTGGSRTNSGNMQERTVSVKVDVPRTTSFPTPVVTSSRTGSLRAPALDGRGGSFPAPVSDMRTASTLSNERYASNSLINESSG
ncbi:hypothetical protein SPRG_20183 [Saprolegnia parasitica CBS 223.65]|uniref:Uncharacterized protein n=1 Tax=Saprolegnia parasitica (strain CBS 223.65) TaxID=695850 RepID=A0A067CN92_SAPPC|nr:hypothetical protein SPRG_20183 [Saprolegnia parasitica CBS 223.65]KDO28021.1 hypothetical protein SPRG_20183 [Saprolegnia parasitica CBS 223.65]|eukprot:XP_012201177.1 hypothetical protein SPRG_20183 [Saprolegnia parasitica CBS 223.65]